MLRHYLVALFNDPRDLPVLERDGRVHFEPEARTYAFVNVHDFVDKQLGKAIPYGVYDVGANAGCVTSASASITTPPNLRSTPFVAGSRRWGARDTRHATGS